MYDFDAEVTRRGTHAVKYDMLEPLFGDADLTPLWVADMDFNCCPEVAEAMRRRCDHEVFGYTVTPESYWEALLAWLKNRHGVAVPREDIAFVPGVVRGIGYAVNYFSRPGDKVLIQPPVYPPFRSVPEGNGRVVVENPLVERNGRFEMDFENLEQVMATERPAMMILCNPHNPGGRQWDVETLRRVASLAKKYDVTVVSDEIHADLMLYGTRHIPFAEVSAEAAEVAVTFGAPSKTFNIPGLCCSWMVVRNPKVREPFFKWMEVNEFSSPLFTSTLGAEAAYRHGEPWLNELLPYIEGNIKAVTEWFAEAMPQVRVLRPEASFLLWIDFSALGLTQEELVERLKSRAHVALNDGASFGTGGEGFMRLNVAMPRRQLMEAVSRIANIL